MFYWDSYFLVKYQLSWDFTFKSMMLRTDHKFGFCKGDFPMVVFVYLIFLQVYVHTTIPKNWCIHIYF